MFGIPNSCCVFYFYHMDKKFEKAKSYLATREDIMATKADIATFKAYIIKWMFILCLGWVGVF